MKTILKPLSAKPKIKNNKKLEDFINAADDHNRSGSFNLNTESLSKSDDLLPWEHPNIRDDVIKPFLIRLTERDNLKLDYIAEKMGKSKHFICCNILKERFEKILDDII